MSGYFYTSDMLDKDIWAVWPDDFMCPQNEVVEYLTPPFARSYDYTLVQVLEYTQDGTPLWWIDCRNSD